MATLAKWLKLENSPVEVIRPDGSKDEFAPVYMSKLMSLKGIDAKLGIHRIGGNTDAYLKQLKRFRERYSTAIDDLQQLIMEKGLREGEEYCHALKGVLGNLGANELFIAINAVDSLLKQEQSPAPAQFEHLRGLLNQIMNEIDNLNTFICIKPSETTLLVHDELIVKLKALIHLLENDFGAAELLLNEIRSGVVGSEFEQVVGEIAAKIDVCAIDEALAAIGSLLSHLNQMTSPTPN